MSRIKIDYGSDGSLESRLYVSGAGRGDAGRYSCVMPGLASVQPANINITVTQGEGELFLIDIDSDLQLNCDDQPPTAIPNEVKGCIRIIQILANVPI